MAGSEYYDDRQCGYCETWYSIDENHSCTKLEEQRAKAAAIKSLENKINTKISYLKAREMYMRGLRAEDIVDVGFKLKNGWVSKYG